MLVVISTGCPPLPPPTQPVSPLVAAAPFVFRKLITTMMAGGPVENRNGLRRLFTNLANLLPMTPTIRRAGESDLSILEFNVCLPIPPMKLPIIPKPMLVLSKVRCILCTTLPRLVLATPFPPLTPATVFRRCLDNFLNVTPLILPSPTYSRYLASLDP